MNNSKLNKKLKKYFYNKKIIVTGHTGFKGSWLSLWLHLLGAKVVGISKNVPTKPSHYDVIKLKNKIKSIKLDINNQKGLKKILLKHKPDYIFHLAAQALVNKSYQNPVETWTSNTFGTMSLLESLKYLSKKVTVVLITSDKVYKNLELKRGYKENDILGGYDPYSASKASTEILINSYIKSFFNKKNNRIFISIARAGNVIGGGDWSENRLVPDSVRAWSKGKKVDIRSPRATRPGYLILAINLNKNDKLHGEAFNFGPRNKSKNNVISLIKEMKKYWDSVDFEVARKKYYYESNLLQLNSTKAKKKLKWKCKLNFNENIKLVSKWYKNFYFKEGDNFLFSKNQIEDYQKRIDQ